MSAIQLILLAAIAACFVSYLSFFRSILLDRLVALAVFGMCVLAIIFPDYTTVIAHGLGVGRGADLILYLFAAATLFALIMLYSQIWKVRQDQTRIVRQLALANPTKHKQP
ncbi:MAG: DUF2304 domain-containing protein [Bdellovibrionales bacterium]|nr:DUF2304 domain-containing protein [Bdellovibrionales bacterium]